MRTLQRWRAQGGGDDARQGPHGPPANKFSPEDRENLMETVNLPEYRNLPPSQIVPRLADKGMYVGSESTMYRRLKENKQLTHRQASRPATHSRPREYVATGPCQVWSWDITYLRTCVRGSFFYLYMIVDVWSRKIVGWEVHESESTELAAELFRRTCTELNLDPEGLVLHQDNGSPMKGSTMLATLQSLGVVASFSRPRVSDDNPYSEALFRTLKYRPEYPSDPFESVQDARTWVASFVMWYNTEHQHSAIRFVTPEQRHQGLDRAILAKRHVVYQLARARNPNRWSGKTRNWEPILEVGLNRRPKKKSGSSQSKAA